MSEVKSIEEAQAEPQLVIIWTYIILVVVFLVSVQIVGHFWFLGMKDKALIAKQVHVVAPELQEIRARDAEVLSEYKLLDAQRDVVQIPIDRAMQALVREDRE